MAHPEYQAFAVEIPINNPEAMETFQHVMNALQEGMEAHIQQESARLGVSKACALDIVYLRSRSRWTEEAEQELIRRDKAGETRPNIYEWPQT